MSERVWTKAQRQAIDYAGRDLLLSAAAGSGKTATLTERIVSLLTAPDSEAEISRILCVTFTRAAASELKNRVGTALRQAIAQSGGSARLTRQLCDLGRARITTIHSFCLSVLRPHFAELSLPAGFSVAEPAEITALSRQVMSDVISTFFEAGEPDFLTLADTLGGARNESSLDEKMLKLAAAVTEHGCDAAELARLADRLASYTSFFSTPAGAGTRVRVRRFAAHYREVFRTICADFEEDDLLRERYLPTAAAALELADALHTAVEQGDYSACRAALIAYDPPSLVNVSAKLQTPMSLWFKKVREAFEKKVKDFRTLSFSLPEAEIAAVTVRTAGIAAAAARVLGAYFETMTLKKRERGAVDYADLEAMTARLLMAEDGTPTDAARDLAKAYDYIFIDEFQDTNRAQDTIFTAIAGTASRFMVGDIKQSIYRFRGAEPEVFAGYRRQFAPLPEEENGAGLPAASIFMRENFRCDGPVVDFTNLVSRHLFRRSSVPFTGADELKFAKTVPEEYTPRPAEVVLLSKDAEKNGTETEPQYVARRIAELLASGRRADGAPITPGDIAILLHSHRKDGGPFAEALRSRGIPVRIDGVSSLYEQPEVVYALSILRAVDNPGRDIDLAAAMRGPVFGFTLGDLVEIRRTCPGGSLWDAVRVAAGILPAEEETAPTELADRCRTFASMLSDLRVRARGMRADALILAIYAETRLEEIAAAEPGQDPAGVAARLRALYDAARRFENGPGGGLYPFLKMMEAAVEEGGGSVEDGSAAVEIMSIHHSKGLEFPVCFLCRADKGWNKQDAYASLLFDPSVGAVMHLSDPDGVVRCKTPLHRSVSAAISDAAMEEEMRVLYVAMTRARERLIVTACVADPEGSASPAADDPAAAHFTEESIFSAPNYITWILNALAEARLQGEKTDCVTVTAVTDSAAEREEPDAESGEAAADLPAAQITAAAEKIRESLAFTYPHRHLAAVPAKLTVSRLYPGILDGDAESAGADPAAPVPSMGERNAPPAFLAGKTEEEAAFAGTATHVFLQFADFDSLAEHGVAAECGRLLARGFITEEMAAAVRQEELVRFTESALFARMRRAQWIRREFRFNAALPAADFTEDPALAADLAAGETDVIVQGVIDALFIDEDGRTVLVDYKTDRLTDKELADPALAAAKLVPRHSNQLGYYRTVTAAMLGREIDECLIYSLPLGDTVPVP